MKSEEASFLSDMNEMEDQTPKPPKDEPAAVPKFESVTEPKVEPKIIAVAEPKAEKNVETKPAEEEKPAPKKYRPMGAAPGMMPMFDPTAVHLKKVVKMNCYSIL